MQTFTSLNTLDTVTFTDNRTPGIRTDIPRAFDEDFTETVKQFDVYNLINITEVIRPEIADVRYKINVSDDTAIQVTWDPIPSGCTVTQVGSIYTIDGIDSAETWEQIKNPTVTVDEDFFGNVSYSAAIVFNDGTQDREIEWNVGLYVPVALLESEFTQVAGVGKIVDLEITLESEFSIIAIGQETLGAQFSLELTPTKLQGPFIATTLEASMSLATDPTYLKLFTETFTIDNPNVFDSAGDNFARSMDYSSNFIAAGAPTEDSSVATNTGRAYVFNQSNGSLVYTFENPNPVSTADNDQFGNSVGINSSTIAVSAPFEDTATDQRTGKVYLFNLSNQNLFNTIEIAGADSNLEFGISVELNEDYLLAAAPNDSSNNGIVYVYNSSGNFLRNLTGRNNGSFFGSSITLQGTTAVITEPGNNIQPGKVYVYNVSTGGIIDTFDIETTSVTNPIASYGTYVAITDNTNNQIRVYNGGSLVYTINNPVGSSNWGDTLAMNNNYIVTGDSGTDYVYIYDKLAGTFVYRLSLEGNSPTVTDLSIDDNDRIIVSNNIEFQQDRLYVYDKN